MLPYYGGDFERKASRAGSLQPRAKRDSRRQNRGGGGFGGDGVFGELMGMHHNAMKEFDNMHMDTFGSSFGSK